MAFTCQKLGVTVAQADAVDGVEVVVPLFEPGDELVEAG